jgi:predicted secreted protein
MSNAISAQGTILARQAGGAGSFVDVAELRDTKPPALTRNEIETTNHNDEDDSIIVGIRRKQAMTVTIGFLPDNATHDHLTGLQQSWDDGDLDGWKVTYPDGSGIIFSGYVTNVSPNAPVDDGLTADVTIKPTGNHEFF